MPLEADSDTCLICGNAHDNQRWTAREMMFGLRDRFEYRECAACGCLTLISPPADLSRYYPADYYAHGRPRRESGLKRYLWRVLADQVLGRPSALGRVLVWRFGAPEFTEWVRTAEVSRDAMILDVGCGNGWLLRHIRAAGWHRLTGVDPFLDHEITWPDGVVLRRCALDEVTGHFDFIMAHHSFEHMPDPCAAARHMARLLAPGGRVLIRVPVADSEAWRTYRSDWVQLDAPRHHVIPTRVGMEHIARQAGLRIERVTYDSTGFQFWGSDQYRHDVALADARRRSGDACLCSASARAQYDARARVLNESGGADQACFYLRAVSPV